jgi:hypothetical protein
MRFSKKSPACRGGELICNGGHGGRARPDRDPDRQTDRTNPAMYRQPRGGDSQVNLQDGASVA